ncbi:hypothetical protein GCM10025868_28520 [Angustibacter aerolatus]|uniref:Lipoprotein n=1 Tax=Angustibacter aerolatus TaxID=1162965 RepID=A0ABQ6JL74_9ACTN|nr:hypothetical protein [Angustibacter aerolatus]GMA87602.1 hypothetical protein GCM10025868_28520 [Angustibacter aerolatus]
MKRPRQRALVAALAAAPLLLTTGCGLTAATTTAYTKDVTDGVDAQVGDVDARNLLVVGRKGTEGVVSGALVNNGDQAVTVTVATQGAPSRSRCRLAPGVLVQARQRDRADRRRHRHAERGVGSPAAGAGSPPPPAAPWPSRCRCCRPRSSTRRSPRPPTERAGAPGPQASSL